MGQIRSTVTMKGSRADAFDLVNDYRSVPGWMFGVTDFEPVSEVTRGLGAKFASTMKIGPKALKSIIEVVEYVEDEKVVLSAIEGVEVTTRWAFRDLDEPGMIQVDIEFDYSLGGGLAGRALSAVVEPAMGAAVKQTEQNLTQQVEARAQRDE